jgi:hypothetical protein
MPLPHIIAAQKAHEKDNSGMLGFLAIMSGCKVSNTKKKKIYEEDTK